VEAIGGELTEESKVRNNCDSYDVSIMMDVKDAKIIETLRWMYPASLYAKSRGCAAGCTFDFAVDVVKETMMPGHVIK